jgi:hypothetical protein
MAIHNQEVMILLKSPPNTNLQKKKKNHWLKRYAIIQAFFCMTMHDFNLHNFV